MRIFKTRVKLTTIIISLFVVCAFAADWPQYYGPNRDGTSTEKGLLRSWPKEGPKVLWTAPVGVGFGGPAVSAGKVYVLDRDEKVGDNLRCFDLSSGKELWNFAYDAPGIFTWPGSRTSPTVEGNNVYTCGPTGELYCISTNTHKPVWHTNIWKDFGGGGNAPPVIGIPPGMRGVPPSARGQGDRQGAPGGPPGGGQLPLFAIAQNPLIYRNILIVASQTPQAGVVAFDKLTGELKWKTGALTGNAGYVSPSIVRIGGEDQLVMSTASRGMGRNASPGSVNGIDPLSGKILWTYSNWRCAFPVPHAVDAGEGRVLITGGYLAGATMLKIQKKEDGSYGITELFKNIDFGSHTQPPILHKDHFYAQYTINERSDGMVCMSMEGQVKWKTGEEPDFIRGGAILVDGLLLSTDGNKMLYLIEPDPSGFKPLARAELMEEGTNWAPIALADGKLLIRDQKNLKCLAVAQQSR